METTIKVISTPIIMGKAFKNTAYYSIRFMKTLGFNDPEPHLPNEKWLKKYGSKELLYEVVLRYPDGKRLKKDYTYNSWRSVEHELKARAKKARKAV